MPLASCRNNSIRKLSSLCTPTPRGSRSCLQHVCRAPPASLQLQSTLVSGPSLHKGATLPQPPDTHRDKSTKQDNTATVRTKGTPSTKRKVCEQRHEGASTEQGGTPALAGADQPPTSGWSWVLSSSRSPPLHGQPKVCQAPAAQCSQHAKRRMHHAAACRLHYAKSELLSLLHGCRMCSQCSSSTHNTSTQDTLLGTTLKPGARQLQNSSCSCYS